MAWRHNSEFAAWTVIRTAYAGLLAGILIVPVGTVEKFPDWLEHPLINHPRVGLFEFSGSRFTVFMKMVRPGRHQVVPVD